MLGAISWIQTCPICLTIGVLLSLYVLKQFVKFYFKNGPRVDSHFDGKTVLITGASSGLGKALAYELGKFRNVKLILASRDVSALEKLSQEIFDGAKEVQISKPDVYPLDLGDSKNVNDFSEKILQHFPDGVDVLVNNAGASVRASCFSTDMKIHRRLMEVNYFGHVQLTQALFSQTFQNLSKQKQLGKRIIICISSVQGRIALPNRSAYCASKHAFNAYFDSLKAELSSSGCKNVNVLTVNPGYLKTNLSLNALTSDGTLSGKMDENQRKGMDSNYAAKQIIESAAKGDSELILADFNARTAIFLRTLCPKLYFYSVVKRAMKDK